MKLSSSLRIVMNLLIGTFFGPTSGGKYDVQLDSVQTNMVQLDSRISELQSVAQANGHFDVHQLCQSAKESLQLAQSGWRNIASSYANEPWLASESPEKESLEEHWSTCGTRLERVYQHSDILPDYSGTSSYSQSVQACKETYDACKSSFEIIWKWSAPKPVPSGIYYKRQNKAHKNLGSRQLNYCPPGETACPLSPYSSSLECIDVQSELTSCGGCVTKNEGRNCMEIPGASGVGCEQGKCVVFSVHPNYFLSRNGYPILRRRS